MDLSKHLPGLKKKKQRRDSDQDVIELSFIADSKTNASTDELNPGPGIYDAGPIEIQPASHHRQFSGWKVGATSAAATGIVTLAVNAAALQWLRGHPSDDASLVELFRGDCHHVEQLQIWSHLAINALSTLLLSGSNYCMQVLCAPTRPELDRAHADRRHLDIGVQSLRNLWSISPYRTVLWWLLGVSSIPLHLMYNSAFYSSIGVSDYRINPVASDFDTAELTDIPPNVFVDSEDACQQNETCMSAVSAMLANMQNSPSVERLDAAACIEAYAKTLLTDRSNLVLVTTSPPNENGTVLSDHYYSFATAIDLQYATYEPFDWMCFSSANMSTELMMIPADHQKKPPCDTRVSKILAQPNGWTPFDFDIDHCLSQTIDQRCSFNGNIVILIVVIVSNVIKILCMLWVAFGLGKHRPMITIGDAIASYVRNPDPITKDHCMWNRRDFVNATPLETGFVRVLSEDDDDDSDKCSIPTAKSAPKKSVYRWASGATAQRWTWTLLLLSLAIIVAVTLFTAGYASINQHQTPMSALGFGKINASALVNGWGINFIDNTAQQIASAIIVANLPQTILSFLYLQLNGLVTCMARTAETLSYNRGPHRSLRVSLPQKNTDQRSTYFLQLPYRLGIPLLILSGVLHWLVSQSFFLAVVAEYNWQGDLVDATAIATCGFSLVPMIIVLVLGVCIFVGLSVAGGFGRWEARGMPLAGSCSLSISAMCHAPVGDEDVELKTLRWGVVPYPYARLGGPRVAHCAFSSGPVDEVDVVGRRKYA